MADIDQIDSTGLQLKSYDVILSELTTDMKSIYGDDINVDSDSPDGQMLNIFAQASTDMREIVQRIYDILDIDNATGANLDRAVALLGITRKGGTRTITPITVTTSAACTIKGINQDPDDPYTVQDNAGNKWNLQNTHYFSGADSASLAFQAEIIGKQETTPNTITTPVTIVLGVSTINNPTVATIVGEDEESDFELRARAKRSVMLASTGFVDSLYAALMNLDGMGSVRILENTTDTTDANGTSPHSIHVIVSGSATNNSIAKTILEKRGAGCGMDGDISLTLLNADGYPIDIKWSNVTAQYLFTFASISSLDGINQPQYALIKSQLPTTYVPAIGDTVTTNQLITAITSIDSNTFVDSASFSFCKKQKFNYALIGGGTPTATPTTAKIKIAYNGNTSAEIDLTDTLSNISAAIKAVNGLSDVTVTHTLGTSLAIEFANAMDVLGAITIAYADIEDTTNSETYYLAWETQDAFQKTSSSGLQYQLALASNRTFLTPIIITPQGATIDAGSTQQFTAIGGTGNYRWISGGEGHYTDYFAAADDGGFNTDGLFDASNESGTVTNLAVKCIDELGNVASTTISIEA